MSTTQKTNKKTGSIVSHKIEVTDLNATDARASIQTRSQGRFSQEAMEVLSSAQDPKGSITAEILYQRMGEQWYAFTSIEDEVYYSPVSAQQVAAARKDEVARIFAEQERFTMRDTTANETDIDALFHQPTTRTGRRTSNGGGNA